MGSGNERQRISKVIRKTVWEENEESKGKKEN